MSMRVNWFLEDIEPIQSRICDYWDDIEIIPRVGDVVGLSAIISDNDHKVIMEFDSIWDHWCATVKLIVLRKDEKGFYYEIWIKP